MRTLAWIALAAIVLGVLSAPGIVILRGESPRMKLITYIGVIGGSLALTAPIVGLVLVATGAWP